MNPIRFSPPWQDEAIVAWLDGEMCTEDARRFSETFARDPQLASRTATLMARVMLGIKVADPMSGFFAIRRELFEELRPALTPRGFKIMLELLCLAVNRKGDTVRVVEHGIIFNRRKHGESKLTARVAAEYLQMLLALRRNRQA